MAKVRIAAPLLLALLTACAATPQEVRDSGNALASTSPVAPERTAQCLRRQWEEDTGEIHGEIVPGLAPGAVELRVRQQDFGVIALYELTPAGANRTAVRMYWRDGYVSGASQQSLDARLARCASLG